MLLPDVAASLPTEPARTHRAIPELRRIHPRPMTLFRALSPALVSALFLATSGCSSSGGTNPLGPQPGSQVAGASGLQSAFGSGAAGTVVAAVGGSSGTGPAVATPAAGSGTFGAAGSSAASGQAGTGIAGTGTGGQPAGQGSPDPSGPRTAAGFMNLAPAMGEPLDGKGKDLDPAAPAGWIWYPIDGAVCRDGSPTGFFVHSGTSDKLLVYLEGGGACSNGPFCGFNPASANSVLAGDGQTVLGTALGAIDGRQQPGVYTQADHAGAPAGIFDFANAQNPFKDWSQVYVPYCTGDVHFGSKRDGTVPGLDAPQQFVGYLNMKLFMARIVPTFKSKVSRVILTGASAGGFGAALNYSMVQDAFGEVQVDAIDDSGPPFDDKYMPVCMQKRWRDSWGLDASLPPDCTECRQQDGGGLLKLSDFLLRKHPLAHIAIISTMQDEVIRLFYSVGVSDCADYDTADPVGITVGQLLDPSVLFAADTYTAGLNDLRARYASSNRLSTFFMGGDAPNLHQHVFRPEFYDMFNGTTQAAYVTDFLAGKVEQLGP
jgi:hypothetical protein